MSAGADIAAIMMKLSRIDTFVLRLEKESQQIGDALVEIAAWPSMVEKATVVNEALDTVVMHDKHIEELGELVDNAVDAVRSLREANTAPATAAENGSLSPAQYDFAATWLAHWRAIGGTETIAADGYLSLILPEWRFSASYNPPSEELSSNLRNLHETFCDGLHMGKARALLDLLETITGGRDAVKSYLVAGRA